MTVHINMPEMLGLGRNDMTNAFAEPPMPGRPADKAPMERELDALSCNLNDLIDEINALESKLGPILTPQPTAGDDQPSSESFTQSAITEHLSNKNRTIRILVTRINILRELVEL